jgi:hypothetical protein
VPDEFLTTEPGTVAQFGASAVTFINPDGTSSTYPYPRAVGCRGLDDDDLEMADAIAGRIVEKLSASVIPSSFPAFIGEWIRETCSHGGHLYRHMIPMSGPTAMFADYRLNPDGTLALEFQDTNGNRFWGGTFRPADAQG